MTKAPSAWRPIETAPKDGTCILAWVPTSTNWGVALVLRWVDLADHPTWCDAGEWSIISRTPSHWMPLPPPPPGANVKTTGDHP